MTTLTEYKQTVPVRQRVIIRQDAQGWYAVLAKDKLWCDNNGITIHMQFAGALYSYLQYNGFSPRYEA